MSGENAVDLPRAGSAPQGLRPAAIVLAILVGGLLLRYWVFLYSGGKPGFDSYLESLCVWDCNWYGSIVEGGYDATVGLHHFPEQANWAFFPLYPSLVWVVTSLTGLPVLPGGFILSNAFAFAAALASRPLFGAASRAWWLFTVGLLIGPFSYLFSTLYSESLFILLTVLALLALKRSDYLGAAIAGALLSATRPTGVLFVFAVLTQMLVDHRRAGGSWRSFPMRVLGDVNLLLPLFLAPLGLFIYMAYLHVHVGDALAFAHVQRSWGRALGDPFSTLASAIGSTFTLDQGVMLRHVWAWAAVIGLVLSGVLLLRGKPAAAVFCALCLLASLATGVGSMVRFVAGLAPLGMVMGELLGRWRLLAWGSGGVAVLAGLAMTLGRLNESAVAM